jgi:hypothetical protein
MSPWYLRTNLERQAESLCPLDARRMSVEDRFRDQKNRRHGWAIRHTRIPHVDRFDCFLRIRAWISILLVGLGLQARRDHDPSPWCPNTRNSECSVSTIGRALVDRFHDSPDELLRRVRYATEQVAMRWG